MMVSSFVKQLLLHVLAFGFLHHDFLIAGTIMTISKDRVKPSPMPDSWKLREIFATGIVFGGYLALMTVIFFWAMRDTDFFPVSTVCSLFLQHRNLRQNNVWDSSFCLHLCRIAELKTSLSIFLIFVINYIMFSVSNESLQI